MTSEFIQSVKTQIDQLKSPEVAASSQRYFWHSILYHGLKMKDSELISREQFSKISQLP